MNWIKQNKKLAVILGVMIVGGLGLGAWLYMAWSDYSAQMEEWTALDQKTTKLENSKIYPSEANIKALGEKIADYRDKFTILQKSLLSVQKPVVPISETEFQAKVKDRSRAVVQKAGKATDLPKDFALGFDEYTNSLPPSPEVAAQLNVQLETMETFVNTLLDAGVRSIDTLDRTKLPSERGGTPPPPKTSAPAPTNQRRGVKPAPVASATEPVLDRHTIKCVFTCDQGPLQAVMNSLADPSKTPQFLAVRQLHVENVKQEAPTKEEIRALTKQKSDTTTASSTAPQGQGISLTAGQRTVPVVKPLDKDAAEIMGGELIKVYMEVDYIRFRQNAEGDASSSATAAKK